MEYIIAAIIVLQITKLAFNWRVHNILNPNAQVDVHVGTSFSKKGMKKSFESDLMFLYANFTMFWIKIPKSKAGKFMAWSVLVISVLQIVGFVMLYSMGSES